MTHWQVSLIGAFDRFNYGDVLFAKVAEHMIARHLPEAEFDFYALKAKDLRNEGGVVTNALRALYDKPTSPDRQHLVMLCGGELLAPTWAQMAEHLVPPSASMLMKRVHRRIGHPNWLWRHVYGCPNRQPWTIDPDDLKDASRVSVVYNAVGGTSIKALSASDLAWQARALRKASWITVRDTKVADAIVKRGLPRPLVVPDSAVVMAELLTEAESDTAHRKFLGLSGLTKGPYLCFQSAERWIRGHEDEVAEALRTVHGETGLNILSFAIGRAPGHDDQVTSRRLKERLGQQSWFGTVDIPLTVNETMAVIANAQCYVGTSLHGFITAFAFGKARVGLMPHLEKLVGFRDTWDLEDMPAGVEFMQIPSAVRQALQLDKAPQLHKAAAAKEAYEQSFGAMMNLIS